MQRCRNCNGTPQNLGVHPQCAACVEGQKMANNLIENSTNKKNWSDFENNKNYKPISDEKNIYAPVGRSSEPDYNDKLIVARSAVEHGYRVWILGKQVNAILICYLNKKECIVFTTSKELQVLRALNKI